MTHQKKKKTFRYLEKKQQKKKISTQTTVDWSKEMKMAGAQIIIWMFE